MYALLPVVYKDGTDIQRSVRLKWWNERKQCTMIHLNFEEEVKVICFSCRVLHRTWRRFEISNSAFSMGWDLQPNNFVILILHSLSSYFRAWRSCRSMRSLWPTDVRHFHPPSFLLSLHNRILHSVERNKPHHRYLEAKRFDDGSLKGKWRMEEKKGI